ncbi:type IV pilin-like G/H family protein [Tumidithrix elongata RA019]|uniref:Type IV pilin-like G/H family protein n=1 Tax=Tumidithrix elongata BACA0141 TaxID=2716417 RepID=A0AAW9Q2L8_9CYAN|nr:type IV pilin-like G/H family protein [Tumidithrix elongata RA019]
MKSDLAQAKKAGQSPLRKRNNRWSLWIRLLIYPPMAVIVAALILPSFLCKANKAHQSGARAYVGALNKGQQAYFTENRKFGSNIDVLGVGLKTDAEDYIFSTRVATVKSAKEQSALNYGISKKADYRSYVGAVFLSQVTASSDVTTLAILCEANAPGDTKPPDPIVKNGIPTCGANTQPVGQ